MGGGASHGDRVVYLGIGRLRGQHADVLGARRGFAVLRFDSGLGCLVAAIDAHPIPRRPKPDF